MNTSVSKSKKTVIVDWTPRAYITRHTKAETAREAAEKQLEMERTGERERQELCSEARSLRGKLQHLRADCCGDEIRQVIERAAWSVLPQTTSALKTWISQVKILLEVVTVEVQRQKAEKEEQERLEAQERRWQDWLARQEDEREYYGEIWDKFPRMSARARETMMYGRMAHGRSHGRRGRGCDCRRVYRREFYCLEV